MNTREHAKKMSKERICELHCYENTYFIEYLNEDAGKQRTYVLLDLY